MEMDAASSTPKETPTATAAAESVLVEERKREDAGKEMVHKTKVIQFLGRTTPIILQNDNGPCPLLAICNVLSLRNCLNLSPDVSEVSQEKLLSLVAERLIDTNSNVNNKDAAYVENQQQNIADAIDLLPRLSTGIDVNLKFRRIDDFEFTRECAIFDLLDIPLYHGWIVDPQDYETANAIGSKSYNTLMGELVALEAQSMKSEPLQNPGDDSVDFVAATTAALGVPSPCLSRGISFDESPVPVPERQSPASINESHEARKGDLEEEAELIRALKLSEANLESPSLDDVSKDEAHLSLIPEESPSSGSAGLDAHAEGKKSQDEASITNDCRSMSCENNDDGSGETLAGGTVCTSEKLDRPGLQIQSAEPQISVEKPEVDSQTKDENNTLLEFKDLSVSSESHSHVPSVDMVQCQSTTIGEAVNMGNRSGGIDTLGNSGLKPVMDSKSSSGRMLNVDEPEASASDIDSSEPIYEGEECILESGSSTCQNGEPVYEGEVVLAEQVDNGSSASEANPRCEITVKEGEVVRNFLKSSASQLTVYGLFCLQDGIKERELCVFFRNNHFNTMFKFEGELYILVTDQGYISQPDLVWEKLNEVNGDTLYMTANFKEFKVDDHANSTWDEQNAMASTADYLASMDSAAQQQLNFNSDLQLAIALQQQEFEQQQAQRNNNSNEQQQPVSGPSRLVTGPQVSRNSGRQTSSSSNTKQESKAAKDKCIVM